MKRLAVLSLVLGVVSSNVGCGFTDEARTCEFYEEHVLDPLWPDDTRVVLVTWPVLVPFHGTGLAVSATIDQTIRTGEIVVPASCDAADYFDMPVPDDNIMLHRTIVVPKYLGTPFVWLGSYIARWFAPISADARVFGSDDDGVDVEGAPGDEETEEEFDKLLEELEKEENDFR